MTTIELKKPQRYYRGKRMRKLPAVFALALKYVQPAVGKMTFIRQVTAEGTIDILEQTSSRQTVQFQYVSETSVF